MTSPTTSPPTIPADAVASVVNITKNVKSQCGSYVTALQAGSVFADQIIGVIGTMKGSIDALTALRDVAGLNAAAIDPTLGVPGYNGTLTADITATANAMQACVTWVITNVPQSGGYMLIYALNGDGTRTVRTFSPAATAGLVTALQAVLATIN